MARALKIDEAEVFKDAISPERRFTLDYGSFEGLAERRDEEMEITADSAFWMGGYVPGATNS
jgi:hypothetical protein